MKTYSEEFKAQIMAQMLPPTHRGIPELARETGIPKDTLYTWRGKQRMAVATPGAKGLRPNACVWWIGSAPTTATSCWSASSA
jgi:transposase-like protein